MARIALVCEPPDGGVGRARRSTSCSGLPAHGYEAALFGPREFKHDRASCPCGCSRSGATTRTRTRTRGRSGGSRARCTGVRPRPLALRQVGRDRARRGEARAAAERLHAARVPVRRGDVGGAAPFGVVVERALAPFTDATICVCEFERDLAREQGPEDAARGRPQRLPAVRRRSRSRRSRPAGPIVGAVSHAPAREADRRAARRDAAVLRDGPRGATRDRRRRAAAEASSTRRRAARPRRRWSARSCRRPRATSTGSTSTCSSSSWEAFPIGPLEALACGVPQVVTAVGGTRRVGRARDRPARPAARAGAAGRRDHRAAPRPRAARAHERGVNANATRSTSPSSQMVAGTAAVYDSA